MNDETRNSFGTEPEHLIRTAMNKLASCPVCGYKLGFLPWGQSGESASHEMCPCCLIEFGYHDDALLDDPRDREKAWDEWRKQWIAEGMKWRSKVKKPPENWNPVSQLERAGFTK